MKKIFFAFMAVSLMTFASSCNKCGYCRFPNNQGNDEAVCQSSSPFESLEGNSYKQAKADCSADGGTWVVTK